MEVKEGFKFPDAGIGLAVFCEEKPKSKKGWTAYLHDVNDYTGDPKTLKANIVAAEKPVPGYPPSQRKVGKTKKGWYLGKCDEDTYPHQTHHLIPKNLLSEQAVCRFLTSHEPPEDTTWGTDYKLVEDKDTSYNIDHHKNGYCLPFASTTSAWKNVEGDDEEAEKAKSLIAFEMMRRAQKQLHQGGHSDKDFQAEEQDGVEEDDIETAGYNKTVTTCLEQVSDGAEKHHAWCERCKKENTKNPTEIYPSKKVVNNMHLVSEFLMSLIDTWQICVSRRAALYAVDNKVGGTVIHRSDANRYWP